MHGCLKETFLRMCDIPDCKTEVPELGVNYNYRCSEQDSITSESKGQVIKVKSEFSVLVTETGDSKQIINVEVIGQDYPEENTVEQQDIRCCKVEALDEDIPDQDIVQQDIQSCQDILQGENGIQPDSDSCNTEVQASIWLSAEEVYQCTLCSERFSIWNNLKWHMKLQHEGQVTMPSVNKYFKCERCGEIFVKRSELLRHKRQHSRENNVCTGCNKTFTTSYYLSRHRGYYCKKVFKGSITVKQHFLLMHTPVCQKKIKDI